MDMAQQGCSAQERSEHETLGKVKRKVICWTLSKALRLQNAHGKNHVCSVGAAIKANALQITLRYKTPACLEMRYGVPEIAFESSYSIVLQ